MFLYEFHGLVMYIFDMKSEYFLQEVNFAHFWLYKVPLQLFGLIVNEHDDPFKR